MVRGKNARSCLEIFKKDLTNDLDCVIIKQSKSRAVKTDYKL